MNIRRQLLGLFTAASLVVAAPALAHPVFHGDSLHNGPAFDGRIAFRDRFTFHYFYLYRPDDLPHVVGLALDEAIFAIGRDESMQWQAKCWWCQHWDAKPTPHEPTAAVPEPGSLALFGLASLALFAWRRKPQTLPMKSRLPRSTPL
jgi:hypothetical protein